MRYSLLILLILIGCANDPAMLATDGGTGDAPSLVLLIPHKLPPLKDALPLSDMTRPDWDFSKCSPAGMYHFKPHLVENTCPGDILEETFFDEPFYMKSYECYLYWMDGYLYYEDGPYKGMRAYCNTIYDVWPTGIEYRGDCTLLKDKEKYCFFKWATRLTHPEGWYD